MCDESTREGRKKSIEAPQTQMTGSIQVKKKRYKEGMRV